MRHRTPTLLVLNRHDRYAFLKQLIEFRNTHRSAVRIIATHESQYSALATLKSHEGVSFRAMPSVIMNEFPQWLVEVCDEEGVSMILPTGDVEMIHLSGRKDFFIRRGVRMAIPDQRRAVEILDNVATRVVFRVSETDDRPLRNTPRGQEPFHG